jgi:hypothetical protein
MTRAIPEDGEAEEAEQVKHTLQLPLKLWEAFGRRARRSGISKAEALRRAVWVFNFLADRIDDGSEIIIRDKDGKEQRLVISPY